MTAGSQNTCRPARTVPISSMVARMAGDIAPRGIFGKLEMPDLRGFRLTGTERSRDKSTFQRLVDRICRRPPPRVWMEPGLKQPPGTLGPL